MPSWPAWLGGRPATSESSPGLTRAELETMLQVANGGANADASEQLDKLHSTGGLPYTGSDDPLMFQVIHVIEVHRRMVEFERSQRELIELQPKLAGTLVERITALIRRNAIFDKLYYDKNREDLGRFYSFTPEGNQEELTRLIQERYEELLAGSWYDRQALIELGDLINGSGRYEGLVIALDHLPERPSRWDDLVARYDLGDTEIEFEDPYDAGWPQVIADISRALRTNHLVLGARILDSAARDEYTWYQYAMGDSLVRLRIMVDRLRETRIRQEAEAAEAIKAAANTQDDTSADEEEPPPADPAPDPVPADPAPAAPAPSTDETTRRIYVPESD